MIKSNLDSDPNPTLVFTENVKLKVEESKKVGRSDPILAGFVCGLKLNLFVI